MVMAMMFMANQASAVWLGWYDTGQLVPRVYHDGANVDTVVGITCIDGDGNADGCDVYWAFFDKNSAHITDGMIQMTDDDYYGFSWKAESGVGLEGVEGYLVFTSGDNVTQPNPFNDIFANAFFVDTAGNDAVLVPVAPLCPPDYNGAMIDLEHMDETSIRELDSGSWPDWTLDIRYWIDPAYNATTQIVLWSVCDASGTYTVNIFNDAEGRKSVNFELENEELNIVDPAAIVGRPAAYIDGFIRFTVPDGVCDANETNDMFVFSYVDSDLIGAMQTLLAGEFL
jgi:hypothetical protein